MQNAAGPAPPVPARDAIEQLIGQPVDDPALYGQALIHRSFGRGLPSSQLTSNERLEFLGDAVLGAIVAERLYLRFPGKREGYLTRLREKLVNGSALARAARHLDLGPHLQMSTGAEDAGGRSNPALLSDAYEALIGAIYLDRGLEAAARFINRTLLDRVELHRLADRSENYKSLLQEHVQAYSEDQPTYEVLDTKGPPHDRIFTVQVLLGGQPCGSGTAPSKKEAEQQAAQEALEQLSGQG